MYNLLRWESASPTRQQPVMVVFNTILRCLNFCTSYACLSLNKSCENLINFAIDGFLLFKRSKNDVPYKFDENKRSGKFVYYVTELNNITLSLHFI